MGAAEKESIRKLQAAIRQQRANLGLPKEGPLPSLALLEAMKKNPPIPQMVKYVKNAINNPTPETLNQKFGNRPGIRFDRRA